MAQRARAVRESWPGRGRPLPGSAVAADAGRHRAARRAAARVLARMGPAGRCGRAGRVSGGGARSAAGASGQLPRRVMQAAGVLPEKAGAGGRGLAGGEHASSNAIDQVPGTGARLAPATCSTASDSWQAALDRQAAGGGRRVRRNCQMAAAAQPAAGCARGRQRGYGRPYRRASPGVRQARTSRFQRGSLLAAGLHGVAAPCGACGWASRRRQRLAGVLARLRIGPLQCADGLLECKAVRLQKPGRRTLPVAHDGRQDDCTVDLAAARLLGGRAPRAGHAAVQGRSRVLRHSPLACPRAAARGSRKRPFQVERGRRWLACRISGRIRVLGQCQQQMLERYGAMALLTRKSMRPLEAFAKSGRHGIDLKSSATGCGINNSPVTARNSAQRPITMAAMLNRRFRMLVQVSDTLPDRPGGIMAPYKRSVREQSHNREQIPLSAAAGRL